MKTDRFDKALRCCVVYSNRIGQSSIIYPIVWCMCMGSLLVSLVTIM